jgi:hypothetical protein
MVKPASQVKEQGSKVWFFRLEFMSSKSGFFIASLKDQVEAH